MGEIKLLTKKEKAEELGVGVRTITNRVKKGTINYFKVIKTGVRVGPKNDIFFFPEDEQN